MLRVIVTFGSLQRLFFYVVTYFNVADFIDSEDGEIRRESDKIIDGLTELYPDCAKTFETVKKNMDKIVRDRHFLTFTGWDKWTQPTTMRVFCLPAGANTLRVTFRQRVFTWLITDGVRTVTVEGTYGVACRYANAWREDCELPWEGIKFRAADGG